MASVATTRHLFGPSISWDDFRWQITGKIYKSSEYLANPGLRNGVVSHLKLAGGGLGGSERKILLIPQIRCNLLRQCWDEIMLGSQISGFCVFPVKRKPLLGCQKCVYHNFFLNANTSFRTLCVDPEQPLGPSRHLIPPFWRSKHLGVGEKMAIPIWWSFSWEKSRYFIRWIWG